MDIDSYREAVASLKLAAKEAVEAMSRLPDELDAKSDLVLNGWSTRENIALDAIAQPIADLISAFDELQGSIGPSRKHQPRESE
jgi:hypothetical protein